MYFNYNPKDYMYDWSRFGQQVGDLIRGVSVLVPEILEYNKQIKENRMFIDDLKTSTISFLDKLDNNRLAVLAAAQGEDDFVDKPDEYRNKLKQTVNNVVSDQNVELREKELLNKVFLPLITAAGSPLYKQYGGVGDLLALASHGELTNKAMSTKIGEIATEDMKREKTLTAQMEMYEKQKDIDYKYKEIEKQNLERKEIAETERSKYITNVLSESTKYSKLEDVYNMCNERGLTVEETNKVAKLWIDNKNVEIADIEREMTKPTTTKEQLINPAKFSELEDKINNQKNNILSMQNTVFSEFYKKGSDRKTIMLQLYDLGKQYNILNFKGMLYSRLSLKGQYITPQDIKNEYINTLKEYENNLKLDLEMHDKEAKTKKNEESIINYALYAVKNGIKINYNVGSVLSKDKLEIDKEGTINDFKRAIEREMSFYNNIQPTNNIDNTETRINNNEVIIGGKRTSIPKLAAQIELGLKMIADGSVSENSTVYKATKNMFDILEKSNNVGYINEFRSKYPDIVKKFGY